MQARLYLRGLWEKPAQNFIHGVVLSASWNQLEIFRMHSSKNFRAQNIWILPFHDFFANNSKIQQDIVSWKSTLKPTDSTWCQYRCVYIGQLMEKLLTGVLTDHLHMTVSRELSSMSPLKISAVLVHPRFWTATWVNICTPGMMPKRVAINWQYNGGGENCHI